MDAIAFVPSSPPLMWLLPVVLYTFPGCFWQKSCSWRATSLVRHLHGCILSWTLGGQKQLLPSDVLDFGILCFLSPAACSLYVPCREFSPCKQAAGNVNLAWHFPAHPPHFCSALGDACSLLHCSLQPHSVVLLFQKLPQAALQPSHPWYFSTCGYHQPRCLCSSLGCTLLPLVPWPTTDSFQGDSF